MVPTLHRPNGIAFGTERLGRVGLNPDVNNDRMAVDRNDERTDIIVVMGVTVVAGTCRDEEPPRIASPGTRNENLHVGQPRLPDQWRVSFDRRIPQFGSPKECWQRPPDREDVVANHRFPLAKRM